MLGGADYDNILPPGSFINARDFYSPEHLANYLHTVLTNSTLHQSYFQWRSFYNIHRYQVPPALAVIDISQPLSNSPGVSQQVYFHVCLILFASYASVPDNCQLCDLLWSGHLQERKTYEDMFDWLIRKAECVYTSPSWTTDQYLQVWREERREKRLQIN